MSDKPTGTGFGFRRKFLFKIQERVGNIEETQMTPEFNENMHKFDTYSQGLFKLIENMERAIQPDPNVLQTGKIEAEKDKDPCEKASKAIEQFKAVAKPNHADLLQRIAEVFEKMARTKREYQIKNRLCMRHMRRYAITEYKTVEDARDKFNQARSAMDLAKHEVKQSKTTEQIEKRAVYYQQSVEVFDEHSNKVIQLMNAMPGIKLEHSKDMAEFLSMHKEYHTVAAAITKFKE